jgi:hypothetical protein
MSEYTKAVENGLKGINFPSTGICPGCSDCASDFDFKNIKALDTAYESGELCNEAHFSWRECGICGSQLGGDREVWHWVDDNNVIVHEPGACVDCIMYLANGDEPDTWTQYPKRGR